MSRYVLCRPLGGLNDILCQIEKCCRYAEAFARTVIVETEFPGTIFFADRFDRYFTSRQDVLVLSAAGMIDSLPDQDVQPAFLRGRLKNYRLSYHQGQKRIVDAATSLPVTFDFDVDHPEAVLVHQQVGGGLASFDCLARMTLKPALVGELARRYAVIGGGYAAIHIRHSDMKTDYREAIRVLQQAPPDRLLVATDNGAVLEELKTALGPERIFSFASLPIQPGKPLHQLRLNEMLTRRRNGDAILDLLMLALARRLHVMEVVNYQYAQFSGYSMLARALFEDKDALRRLIADPRFPCRPDGQGP